MSKHAQGDHPGYQQDHGVVVPSHAAATATETAGIFVAQRAGRLKSVDMYPRADIVGADTNSTTLDVTVNGVSKATLALNAASGTQTANVKKNLYAPATPLALAAGDVVALKFTKVGTGLLVPDLFMVSVIDFEP